MSGTDVLDPPVRYDREGGNEARRKRRSLYLIFTTVVALTVAAALIEVVTATPIYGLKTATAHASNADVSIDINYPKVTRGQLWVKLELTIRQQDGFSGPVAISVSSAYFEPFVNIDTSPQPTSETTNASDLLLTFDPPPDGNVLVVEWQMTAQPIGWFQTAHGQASVLDDQQRPIVTGSFDTEVRP